MLALIRRLKELVDVDFEREITIRFSTTEHNAYLLQGKPHSLLLVKGARGIEILKDHMWPYSLIKIADVLNLDSGERVLAQLPSQIESDQLKKLVFLSPTDGGYDLVILYTNGRVTIPYKNVAPDIRLSHKPTFIKIKKRYLYASHFRKQTTHSLTTTWFYYTKELEIDKIQAFEVFPIFVEYNAKLPLLSKALQIIHYKNQPSCAYVVFATKGKWYLAPVRNSAGVLTIDDRSWLFKLKFNGSVYTITESKPFLANELESETIVVNLGGSENES